MYDSAPTFECQVEYGNTTSYLTQGESIILNFTASLYRNQLYEIVIKKVKNPVEQCHSNTRDRTVSITGLAEKLPISRSPSIGIAFDIAEMTFNNSVSIVPHLRLSSSNSRQVQTWLVQH